ncbi:MAG: FtsX-like permease family protein [bacterium]
MQTNQLLRRNLTHYWRTNLAVVLGVATAVAVLAGALLVGDSVRASLRDLFVQRLGQTEYVITAPGFFREQLNDDLQKDGALVQIGLGDICPLIEVAGSVTLETNKSRAGDVRVYGVDPRFWEFHGRDKLAPQNNEVFLSESLAKELQGKSGDSLLVQLKKPSDVPIESLYGEKENVGSTLRLTIGKTLTADQLGEFSTRPQQAAVRAVFVSLKRLQKEFDKQGMVNVLLVSRSKDSAGLSESERTAALSDLLKKRVDLEDYNIKLRLLDETRGISLERTSTLLNDKLAETARVTAEALPARSTPVLSYLVNSITSGSRTIPYSLATGVNDATFKELQASDRTRQLLHIAAAQTSSPIILNEWAARDLGVKQGEPVSLEYFIWNEGGHLETKSAQFQVAAIVPLQGLAADKDLVPEYPGITGSENLSDWDPPFPVDLKRVRKQDEDYWHQYRATPKAFLPLGKAQTLWQSRFGVLTSIRILPDAKVPINSMLDAYRRSFTRALDPSAMGFAVIPVRAQGLASAQGATDFGEYFLYFSFFLVISALLLTALFFKLGIEQRLREIGLLQAVGFPAAKIRSLFLAEGIVLSVVGSLLGLVGAFAYAELLMFGLRTWWVDAVGTKLLSLHVSPFSIFAGAAGGIVAAVVCVLWTLRRLGKSSTRSLLTGQVDSKQEAKTLGDGDAARRRRGQKRGRVLSSLRVAILLTVLGVLLLISSAAHLVGQAGGFFGGGVLLLSAFLCYQSAILRRGGTNSIHGKGWWPVARLGFRNATFRSGRSVLCIALVASAAFIIVAVDSFRHRAGDLVLEKKSGSGGFPLLADSLLPLVHDPNTEAGRAALNLTNDNSSSLSKITFTRFRVRPGDDTSCLNLYQPTNPKIIAPRPEFIQDNRFVFSDSIAGTKEENENPWLLLNREFPDGAIPVIADANSLTYVLHLKVGDDLVVPAARPLRLRVVGALADSIFQSELLMSEANFVHLFPEQEGYRFFLIDTSAPEQSAAVAAALEDRLTDFGFDVVPTSERLASFHRVENTYLSTFQMLGGLGLLLGTLGMAAVLLRNVLERRRELALLRAVGYNSEHFALMVVAENAFLLFSGLITGTVCALLAIAPVFLSRHAQLPSISLGVLLLAVLVSGLTASIVATWATLRSPLLPALRSE